MTYMKKKSLFLPASSHSNNENRFDLFSQFLSLEYLIFFLLEVLRLQPYTHFSSVVTCVIIEATVYRVHVKYNITQDMKH